MAQRGWQTLDVTFLQVFNLPTGAARPFCRVWVEEGAEVHVTDAQPLRRTIQWTDLLTFRRVPYGAQLNVEVADVGERGDPLGFCAIQLTSEPIRLRPGLAPAAVHLKPGVPVEVEVSLRAQRKLKALPAHVFIAMVARTPMVLTADVPAPVLGAGLAMWSSRPAPLQRGGSKRGLMALRMDAPKLDPRQEAGRKRKLLEDAWTTGWLQFFQEEIRAWGFIFKLHHLHWREMGERRQLLREEAVGLLELSAHRILSKGYEALTLAQEQLAQSRQESQQWVVSVQRPAAPTPSHSVSPQNRRQPLPQMPSYLSTAGQQQPTSPHTAALPTPVKPCAPGPYSRLLDECLTSPHWAHPSIAPFLAVSSAAHPRRASLEEMGVSNDLADLMLLSYSESDYLKQLLAEKEGVEAEGRAALHPTATPPPQQVSSPTSALRKSPSKHRQVTFAAAEATSPLPRPGNEIPSSSLEALDQTARQIVEAYRRWEESASQLARWC